MIVHILCGRKVTDQRCLKSYLKQMNSDIETYKSKKMKSITIEAFNSKLISWHINNFILKLICQIIKSPSFDCNDLTQDGADIPFYISYFKNGMSALMKIFEMPQYKRGGYKFTKLYQFRGKIISLCDIALLHTNKDVTIYLLKNKSIPTNYSLSDGIVLSNLAVNWKKKGEIKSCMQSNIYLYLKNYKFINVELLSSWIHHGYGELLSQSKRTSGLPGQHKQYKCNLHTVIDNFVDETDINLKRNYKQIISKILTNQYVDNLKINHPAPLKNLCLKIVVQGNYPTLTREFILHRLAISSQWSDIEHLYRNKHEHNLYRILEDKYKSEKRELEKKKLPPSQINEKGHQKGCDSDILSQQSFNNRFNINYPQFAHLDSSTHYEDTNNVRYSDFDMKDKFKYEKCDDIRCLKEGQIVYYKKTAKMYEESEIHSVIDNLQIKISEPFLRHLQFRNIHEVTNKDIAVKLPTRIYEFVISTQI